MCLFRPIARVCMCLFVLRNYSWLISAVTLSSILQSILFVLLRESGILLLLFWLLSHNNSYPLLNSMQQQTNVKMFSSSPPPATPTATGETSRIKSFMGRTPAIGILKSKFLTVLGNSNELLNGISSKVSVRVSKKLLIRFFWHTLLFWRFLFPLDRIFVRAPHIRVCLQWNVVYLVKTLIIMISQGMH